MNIRETLISGGALAPCGSQPDGTKTHNDCLRTGVYIGKKIGRKEGRKRQEVFGKKQEELASKLGEIKGKKKTQEQLEEELNERLQGMYELGKEIQSGQTSEQLKRKSEFSKRQQKLASQLGEIAGKKQEKKTGRVQIDEVTNDVLKGLLQKMGVRGYRSMNRNEVLQELRRRGINFIKLEGLGVTTTYKSLKGRGCMC